MFAFLKKAGTVPHEFQSDKIFTGMKGGNDFITAMVCWPLTAIRFLITCSVGFEPADFVFSVLRDRCSRRAGSYC
jgi:hypothetical protein